MPASVDQLDPKEYIIIKGARVHNLKNIDVAIPRNKLVVITGLSGSGKSSLAFSTLYAEGQRRYVESLSAYARQFLGKVEKPDVDYIKGVAPAIAIEQKVNTTNSRSTVGTTTEIYDYLKLLFARIGKTISPISGEEVKKHTPKDVVNYILKQKAESKIWLLSPVSVDKKELKKKLELLIQQGYSRLWVDGEMQWLEEADIDLLRQQETIYLVIDRYKGGEELEEQENRIWDSVEIAFFEGKQNCRVVTEIEGARTEFDFSSAFEKDGMVFEEPSVHLFTFNNPIGACPTCEGFGKVIGIDEDLVIPNKSLSVYQDAILPWKGEKMQKWKNELINHASRLDFPIHKPVIELSPEQYELLWTGNSYFSGLHKFFKYLSKKSYKIHYRVMMARYRGRTTCPDCKGKRLRQESEYVKIDGHSLPELVTLSLKQLTTLMKGLKLNDYEKKVSKRLVQEINNRLDYLLKVGVGYLTLNRTSASLSGGESQRINLATSLGSSLVGSMYILDEPSIGLHPRDTARLIEILKALRDLGNTVIIVEHDEDIIRAADEVIDLGPEAGSFGGELVFQGSVKQLLKADTLTAKYLNRILQVAENGKSSSFNNFIEVTGARENNLKAIDVKFPLHALTVVSGVSGSGKSSLVKKIIYPALQKKLGGYGDKTGAHKEIKGAIQQLSEVEFIDQNPIGKSSRSNPVTYIKAYDEIRNLFASLGLAKSRGYKASHFSFNVDGGRCEVCQGEGEIVEEMQFMADIHLVCENCQGKRFKEEILEVKFQGKSIADVLDLTVDEAITFFAEHQENKQSLKVAEKLDPLLQVGLGYVKLGQASGTLSGGEAQRIKLASYLGKGGSKQHILFIFDEPTTGLHFHDISKLLRSFRALIKQGHSLLVIEHNTEVIKNADWLIELGPEGGDRGGCLLYQGKASDIALQEESVTAEYL
jgi:excinuclease ABC subunit A